MPNTGIQRATRAVRAAARRGGVRTVPRTAKPDRWDPTLTSSLYRWCMDNGFRTRPQYLWPVLHCAHAAHALGIERVAALEFGVAGGNGLLALEEAARAASAFGAADVKIVGFDTGAGMPAPVDHRDCPWLIEPGYFKMDEAALRQRLKNVELVLGPVAETIPGWAQSGHPPIGFISFDLDYYSSTMDAFQVLEGDPERLLPRVLCYFDDVFGYGWTDFVGQRAAIESFNSTRADRKLGKLHGLRFELPRQEFHESWHEKLYVLHVFDHSRYDELEGVVDQRWLDAHRLVSQ